MEYKKQVKKMFIASGIAFTTQELDNIEYADFNLGRLETEGLNLIVYVNNDRYCAKEMALLPYQTCPEHRHPTRNVQAGKQETFRCRQGKVYLYIAGKGKKSEIQAKLPNESESFYTVFHEIILLPGEQYTIAADTLHWFQSGAEGAIVSEFSSPSDDGSDIFTDPNIKRVLNE